MDNRLDVPKSLLSRREDTLYVFFFRYITSDGKGLLTTFHYRLYNSIGFRGTLAIVHDHSVAIHRKAPRDSRANPAATSRNQDRQSHITVLRHRFLFCHFKHLHN